MTPSNMVVSDLIQQIADNVELLHELCFDFADEIYTTDDEQAMVDALSDILIAFEEGTTNE